MVIAEKFIDFLPEGSTRPFIESDHTGEIWVAKALRDSSRNKPPFNEFIGGSLANWLGIPWPQIDLIELNQDTFDALARSGVKIESKYCAGIKYVNNLKQIDCPPVGTSNGEHISAEFGSTTNFDSFYGKCIFDNWILMRDIKYGSLFRTKDGNVLFMDASMAFNGSEWEIEELNYTYSNIQIWSPYLENLQDVLTDLGNYDKWLDSVLKFDKDYFHFLIEKLPPDWNVPTDYLDALASLLLEKAPYRLVDRIRERIKNRGRI